MLRDWPFIAIEIGANGTLDDFSRTAIERIGPQSAVRGTGLEVLFDKSSCVRIRSALAKLAAARIPVGEPIELRLPERDVQTHALPMRLITLPARHGLPARLYVCEDVTPEILVNGMFSHTDVLRGFIEEVNEPIWGIGFDEPVDLTENEDGIVHQVFSNECHWMICNRATRAFYGIAESLDMHSIPVAAQFPRSAQNETFIRQLARRHFRADNLMSVDVRADGTAIYVENNVYSHIRGARLYRIWGTLRDVTGERQEQERIRQQREFMLSVLAALPVAVVVIDRDTRIRYSNPAADRLMNVSATNLLMGELSNHVNLVGEQSWLRWCNGEIHGDGVELRTLSGANTSCALTITPLNGESDDLFVVSLMKDTTDELARRSPA